MNKKLIKKATKKVVKKPTIKNSNTNSNTNLNITEKLKKQVFNIIIEDLISALQTANHGESIRIGKLGRIKKTFSKRKINGKLYSFNRYSFKAYSTLKNY